MPKFLFIEPLIGKITISCWIFLRSRPSVQRSFTPADSILLTSLHPPQPGAGRTLVGGGGNPSS